MALYRLTNILLLTGYNSTLYIGNPRKGIRIGGGTILISSCACAHGHAARLRDYNIHRRRYLSSRPDTMQYVLDGSFNNDNMPFLGK